MQKIVKVTSAAAATAYLAANSAIDACIWYSYTGKGYENSGSPPVVNIVRRS